MKSFLIVLLCLSPAFAQLKLIPTPRTVQVKSERFTFKDGMAIHGAGASNPVEAAKLNQLIDEVHRDLNVSLEAADQASAVIWFGWSKEPMVRDRGDEAYKLSVSPAQ